MIRLLALLTLLASLSSLAEAQTGIASWYGPGFQGHRTASGERFNTHAMTCAHRTAKFGTRLHVTSLSTGKSIVCRVTDRGPFVRGRIIDLSQAAMRALAGSAGTVRVRVN